MGIHTEYSCNECGFTINDSIEECPICKSEDFLEESTVCISA